MIQRGEFYGRHPSIGSENEEITDELRMPIRGKQTVVKTGIFNILQYTGLEVTKPSRSQSAGIETAFVRQMIDPATYMNAVREEVFLKQQTVDKVTPAFNELQNELKLLTEEAKKIFSEERVLTER